MILGVTILVLMRMVKVVDTMISDLVWEINVDGDTYERPEI